MSWLSDSEQNALLESSTNITAKIGKAVREAIQALGLGALPEDIQKVHKMAQRIDRRQKQLIDAELRSLSARASTFKSNVAEDE